MKKKMYDYEVMRIEKQMTLDEILFYITFPEFGYGFWAIDRYFKCNCGFNDFYGRCVDNMGLYCPRCNKTIELYDILVNRLKLSLNDLKKIENKTQLPKWREFYEDSFYD
jgi:hypothetical protein